MLYWKKQRNHMEFEIEYCHEKLNPQWDDFVNQANAEVIQTTAWANYEYEYMGRHAVRFYVKNEGTIIAGCQISIVTDKLLGDVGLVRSGPCFITKTPELMILVVSELKKSIQIFNLAYLMVYPDYKEHDLIPFLEREKFVVRFPFFHPPYRGNVKTIGTLFLDLSLSTEGLLNQMHNMRRRGIKKGLNSPFQVKHGGRDDLKVFFDLYHSTVRKNKFTDPNTNKTTDWYPEIESYRELCQIWDNLFPYGWVKLFLGTVDDEVICGALTFPFGKIFRYTQWGWNGKYDKYHISDAIQWEMIQWAKSNGYQYYDFCEINLKVAEAYHSSEPIPEALKATRFYGPTMFKLHFGGIIIKNLGEYVCYSNKMKYLIDTSVNDLEQLFDKYWDFFWAEKNFFRDRQEYKFGHFSNPLV